MPELTPAEKDAILKRRGYRSDKSKRRYPSDSLEIHHKDRNPINNDPKNLRVLTKKEHRDLHKRAKR